MFFHIPFIHKPFPTFVTFEWPFFCAALYMSFHIPFITETFLTHVTVEWFFLGVASFMDSQFSCVIDPLSAIGAAMLHCVNFIVPPQLFMLGKYLVTFRAAEWTFLLTGVS